MLKDKIPFQKERNFVATFRETTIYSDYWSTDDQKLRNKHNQSKDIIYKTNIIKHSWILIKMDN